jgi:hypothetical protein
MRRLEFLVDQKPVLRIVLYISHAACYGVRLTAPTGFLDFNHGTYLKLVKLLEKRDIATVATDTSYPVMMATGFAQRAIFQASALRACCAAALI